MDEFPPQKETTSPLSDPLLQEFFLRTGLGQPEMSSEALNNVLNAFAKIPYENLTKILHAQEIGAPYKPSPAEVLSGYWASGTGGTCFSLTPTLLHLVRALGYTAHAILADRRYGTNTHCAAIISIAPGLSHDSDTALQSAEWYVVDPGYMITTPLELPRCVSTVHSGPSGMIQLKPHQDGRTVDLITCRSGESEKYRLTYKIEPVSDDEFARAWDESFKFDMMRYPVVSTLVDETHMYLQKNSLYVRSPTQGHKIALPSSDLVAEIAARFKIDITVVARAVQSLGNFTE